MITILFVDDEEIIRGLVTHVLGMSGDMVVDAASSAEMAIGMMKETIYDAIVCDYEMPGGMDGIAFLKKIREEGNQIPFLIFTGKGQEEVAIDAINHGADFYIQKGESPRAQFADLVQKIGQAVQRRRTENALRESERNYRDLLESLPDLVLTTDVNGIVTSINSPGARLQHVRPESVLEKPWTKILTTSEARRAQDAFLAMMDSGTPIAEFHSCIASQQPDLAGIPVTLYGTVIRSEAGVPAGARMIFRNIVEQERASERIRAGEERFITLLSLLPVAVIVIDPEGIVRQWNIGAAINFGWTAEEAIGKPFPIVPPTMEDEFRKIVSWCKQNEKLRNIQFIAKKCNGTLARVMVHAAPLHDGKGAVTEIILVITPSE